MRDERAPESDRFETLPHPRETAALFGHREAEATLLQAFRSGRLPQAWIVAGPEGIGKATLAWRFARFLLANPDPRGLDGVPDLSVDATGVDARRVAAMAHADVALLRREWNDKSKRHFTEIRVDEVRRATQLFRQASARGGWRICILDCAENLNRNAANALLKIVEEPPPRSLFLIVAHRPGSILPTIRSRCRLLLLQPLALAEVADAAAVALVGRDVSSERIRAAAEQAGGSVRQALELLESSAGELRTRIDAALAGLPRVDWQSIHRIADAATSRDAPGAFDAVLAAVRDWLHRAVVSAAASEAVGDRLSARLAPYAQVWEKLALAARETEALNLDKRPLILQLFADLAAATRTKLG